MLMHCSEDRGRLVSNGAPIGTPGIARLLGLSEREAEQAIQVLTSSGVASCDESGALICRRMVREQETVKRRREAGRLGGYSKALANVKQNNGALGLGELPKDASKPQAKPKAKLKQITDIDIDSLNSGNGKKKAASLEEVLAFCRELGLPRTDAEWFWHKCEENGWQNGGKSIRDWRLTLRSWHAAGYVPSIKNPRRGIPPPAQKREIKPQPAGWNEWLAASYPGAIQRDYWLVSADVQREFNGR